MTSERAAVDEAELTRFAFNDVTVDLNTYEISREGLGVSVEPQVFDVLRHLIVNRDRVVTKEDLLDSVWGDRFVSESALTSRIKSARRAVGDDGRRQGVIRTVHGRGYQFVAELSVAELSIAELSVAEVSLAEHSITAASGPAAGSPPSTPTIAPPPRRTMGRDDLLERVPGLIESVRLATLVGPAGVGKTHLARALAVQMADRFSAGCLLVSLADVRDPMAVDQAILDSLGVRRAVGTSSDDTIVAALQGADMLVVLDNCEHVREAVARTVAKLRSADVRAAVLATSRRRLGVPGERVVDVAPLEQAVAEALLVERLEDYGGSAEGRGATIARICRRLDNLPLALELAGHQARVLGVDRLADLLDGSLQYVSALESSPGEHHRTLDQSIAASFSLLDEEQQEALCRLSVFAGSFDLDAAVAVGTAGSEATEYAMVQRVVDLAEHSLLVVESLGGRQRYRLLEAVRQFVEPKLVAAPIIEFAHLRHYRSTAEEQSERIWSGDYVDAYHQTDLEWPNHRAAIAFALGSGHLDEACRLVNATVDYADVAQRVEHVDWCESIVGQAEEEPDDVDADLLVATKQSLARLLVLQDLDRSAELITGVDPATNLSTAVVAAWGAAFAADDAVAEQHLATALDIVRGTGGLAELYVNALIAFLRKGSDPMLAGAGQRIRQISSGSGGFARAFELFVDSVEAAIADDLDKTIEYADAAIALASEDNIELIVLGGYRTRARALTGHPDTALAAEQLRAGVERYRRQGHWTAVIVDSPLAAQLLMNAGRVHQAAQILAGFRAAGLVGSWSTPLSDLLTLSIELNHPDEAAAMAATMPLSPKALGDYTLAQLDDLVASLRAGEIPGTESGPVANA